MSLLTYLREVIAGFVPAKPWQEEDWEGRVGLGAPSDGKMEVRDDTPFPRKTPGR